jgi:hypothetical protein
VDPNHPWQLPQSRAYIGSNPRATCGNKLGVRPRPDPKEKSVNERRTVVEQSTTPLNGSMEGLAEETKNCQPKVPQRAVFPAGPY